VSEELALLYQVQQVDTELASLRADLAKLDDGAELTAEVGAAENEHKSLRSQLHAAEAESRALELEVKTLQEKKTKFESQLYGGTVRNPRQLSDLQDEVTMLNREVSKLEDRELELMEKLETLRAEIARREQELTDRRTVLAAVVARYQSEVARITREVEEQEARRKELIPQVDVQLLKRYEQIRGRQSNLGIVKVVGDTCPGCRVFIASEVQKELRAHRVGVTCENCGRLLFRERIVD